MSRRVADHAGKVGDTSPAAMLDAAIAPILQEIEQEHAPQRLLDLAVQLQTALASKRRREASS